MDFDNFFLCSSLAITSLNFSEFLIAFDIFFFASSLLGMPFALRLIFLLISFFFSSSDHLRLMAVLNLSLYSGEEVAA